MSYDTLYQIRKTITLSQKLVHDKPEFGRYVGVSPEISQAIALIDTFEEWNKKTKIMSDRSLQTLLFFRDYLVRENKALFACMVSELSKLSFYYGLKDDSISAT